VGKGEFGGFLDMALGSARAMESPFLLARGLNFVENGFANI